MQELQSRTKWHVLLRLVYIQHVLLSLCLAKLCYASLIKIMQHLLHYKFKKECFFCSYKSCNFAYASVKLYKRPHRTWQKKNSLVMSLKEMPERKLCKVTHRLDFCGVCTKNQTMRCDYIITEVTRDILVHGQYTFNFQNWLTGHDPVSVLHNTVYLNYKNLQTFLTMKTTLNMLTITRK